jgi:hypothetical protein
MDHHKRHTPLSIIIILFAIILGAIYLVKEDNSLPKPTENPTTKPPVTMLPAYKCGMTTNTPLPGSTVSFPLVIGGVINNSAATDGCTWVLFEGQGGTVSISDGINTYPTMPVMIAGNWMTSGPVAFSATFTPANPIPSGTPLTITFNEENPSGEGTSDSFSY